MIAASDGCTFKFNNNYELLIIGINDATVKFFSYMSQKSIIMCLMGSAALIRSNSPLRS